MTVPGDGSCDGACSSSGSIMHVVDPDFAEIEVKQQQSSPEETPAFNIKPQQLSKGMCKLKSMQSMGEKNLLDAGLISSLFMPDRYTMNFSRKFRLAATLQPRPHGPNKQTPRSTTWACQHALPCSMMSSTNKYNRF